MLKAFMNRSQSNEQKMDELLSEYIDGTLTVAEQASLEARLGQEPALARRLEGLRLTVSALAQLPEVDTPRNFIISPSMAGLAKPPARPRQRRVWPVFGWATAVATLLLLLVFAGDVFVVAPSLRPEPTGFLAEAQIQSDRVEQTPSIASETALTGTERPVEAAVEQEAAPAAAVPGELAEGAAPEPPLEEIVVEAETVVEMLEEKVVTTQEVEAALPGVESVEPVVGGEGQTPSVDETDGEFRATISPTDQAYAGVAEGTPMFQGTRVPSDALTTTTEVAEAVFSTPQPSTEDLVEGVPLVASPPPERAEAGSDVGPQTLQEQAATPTLVAVVPLSPTESADGATRAAENATPWLRLMEVGLGLAIISLATVTLILRRREG